MIAELPASGTLEEREHAAEAMLARLRIPSRVSPGWWNGSGSSPTCPMSSESIAIACPDAWCGCGSYRRFREGRCWFRTDSDAATLRGGDRFWCDLASGATPAGCGTGIPGFSSVSV